MKKKKPITHTEFIETLKRNAPLLIAIVLLICATYLIFSHRYEDRLTAYAFFVMSAIFILIRLGI